MQIAISSAGVTNLISNIKPFKASGPDDILAYLLKEITYQIAPLLAMVFQDSLNQCKFAADWKVAHAMWSLCLKRVTNHHLTTIGPFH